MIPRNVATLSTGRALQPEHEPRCEVLTEIDICRAFQKKCGVELPIMTDDTESLDPWKIPDVDSQLIMFRRSDDKELKVREM